MDEATYALIGTAYEEVEAKEPWCKDVDNVADVALLSLESLDVYYNSGGESERIRQITALCACCSKERSCLT